MHADPQDFRRAAGIFQALAHPGRLQVACLLMSDRTTTQKQLIEKLGWPQSTVARHVGMLRSRGLLTATRRGTEVHLKLVEPVTVQLMDTVCDWVHPETGEHFTHRFRDLHEVPAHEA